MAMQGSSPYYLHRGLTGSVGPGTGLGSSLVYRPTSNPNVSAHQDTTVGPSFNVDGSEDNVDQGFSIAVGGGSLSEPIKKKRGRPRKYGPDGPGPRAASGSGSVALGLSPSGSNSNTPVERKKKGRPLGSGWKQRLASVGEWMNSSAGEAFTPHVIHVAPGEVDNATKKRVHFVDNVTMVWESYRVTPGYTLHGEQMYFTGTTFIKDIASKILSFAQQRPRALCIMSGSGGVSAVTLRQPASSAGTVTFEGHFEILCLSGSYLISETGASRNRTGGVNVSLSSSDGDVIGGTVGGQLIASKPVQVVVCSFIYGNAKGKSKETDSKEEKYSDQLLSDRTSTQQMNASGQHVAGSWFGSKGIDRKNPNIDIDLASG